VELRQYVFLVWRWLWLVVLGTAVASATAYTIGRSQAPIYRATSTLLVMEGNNGSDNAYSSLLTSERLAQSYAVRLKNHDVLAQASENLRLSLTSEQLAQLIEVQLVDSTQLVNLHVDHPDPRIAQALANEIPAVFAERNAAMQQARFVSLKEGLQAELDTLSGEILAAEMALAAELAKTTPTQITIDRLNNTVLSLRETYTRLLSNYEDVRIAEVRSLDNVVIDESARLPQTPIRPRVLANTLLAAVVGAMVALGLVFLVEYLDDTIKSPQDVELSTGLTTLGAVQRVKVQKPVDGLVVALEPRSPVAESYRQIRTNIQFINIDRQLRTILVTSANQGEGKTTVSTNLAASLAQSGKRVLLVDTDMRRPFLHKLLEVDGSKGLSNLIVRGREDSHYIKSTLIPNLRVLCAGRLPPNPAELLGSERMKEVFGWLQEQADYVIFDSPPLLAVTDAALLSCLVDTTILVVSANQTRYPALATAVKHIQGLDSPIAGVILNKIPANGRFGYAYSYYYHASYTYHNGEDAPKGWRQRLQALNTTFLQLFH
jgi:capsular exopolysaccharide synthesis family protein